MTDELLSELRAWLARNWDPDLTVGEWWERLGLAGWSAPGLPENAYGKGMARADAVLVARRSPSSGPLGPRPGWASSSLRRPSPPTAPRSRSSTTSVRSSPVRRAGASCSANRRPGPTSPAFRRGRCGTATSGSSTARRCGPRAASTRIWACCSPAPIPSVPKHAGISYFAFEMLQDGVDVRPLREMTGHALFNEVFLTKPGSPTRPHRRRQQRMGGGEHDLDERAGRTWARAAGTPPGATRRSPEPWPARSETVGDFVEGNGKGTAGAEPTSGAAGEGGGDDGGGSDERDARGGRAF